MILSVEYDTPIYQRDSVLIFDEVQCFPRAREAINHLVKDGRYDYIETESLISIRGNIKNILIPSEERSVRMYPMDFEEFALAMVEGMLITYIKNVLKKKTII